MNGYLAQRKGRRYARSASHRTGAGNAGGLFLGMPNQWTGPTPISIRFWAFVDRKGDDECWLWTGSLYGHGYGQFFLDASTHHVPAHRVAYQLANGDIPLGLELDHLCRNRVCVNPAHLEAVSHKVNTLRGTGLPADNARKTHCLHGHAFTSDNTYIIAKSARVGRRCRPCHNEHEALRRSKQNAG